MLPLYAGSSDPPLVLLDPRVSGIRFLRTAVTTRRHMPLDFDTQQPQMLQKLRMFDVWVLSKVSDSEGEEVARECLKILNEALHNF